MRRQRDRSMLAVAYHKEPQLSAGLRGQLLCALLGGMVMSSYLAWCAVYFTVTVAVSERAGILKMLLAVARAWRPHDVVGGDVHVATA